jgi:hypothetical protein
MTRYVNDHTSQYDASATPITRSADLAPRFWSKVDQRGPDECWPWIGGKSSRGYGYIKVGGRHVGAHRVLLMLQGTELGAGAFACHTCDNPGCVNPRHVYAGDATSNNRDTVRRGRTNQGGAVAERKAASMREAWAVGRRQRHVYRVTCKRGHSMADAYLTRSTDPSRPVHRRCRPCALAYERAKRAA